MKRARIYLWTAATILLACINMGEPAYAGSLNANEQELMGIISGTYTYNGVTYRVKPQYVQVARHTRSAYVTGVLTCALPI